jgi:ligand-binding sensor domain-containing protein
VLWFGTNKGVSRYDGKNWTTIGIKEGLLDENVYALAITPDANVWAGTKLGVVRIAAK